MVVLRHRTVTPNPGLVNPESVMETSRSAGALRRETLHGCGLSLYFGDPACRAWQPGIQVNYDSGMESHEETSTQFSCWHWRTAPEGVQIGGGTGSLGGVTALVRAALGTGGSTSCGYHHGGRRSSLLAGHEGGSGRTF